MLARLANMYVCMYVCIQRKKAATVTAWFLCFSGNLIYWPEKLQVIKQSLHTYIHKYIHTCIYTYTYFIYKYILYLHGYNLGVSHDVADLQNFAAVKNKW